MLNNKSLETQLRPLARSGHGAASVIPYLRQMAPQPVLREGALLDDEEPVEPQKRQAQDIEPC